MSRQVIPPLVGVMLPTCEVSPTAKGAEIVPKLILVGR